MTTCKVRSNMSTEIKLRRTYLENPKSNQRIASLVTRKERSNTSAEIKLRRTYLENPKADHTAKPVTRKVRSNMLTEIKLRRTYLENPKADHTTKPNQQNFHNLETVSDISRKLDKSIRTSGFDCYDFNFVSNPNILKKKMSSYLFNHTSSLRAEELFNNYSLFDKILVVDIAVEKFNKDTLNKLYKEFIRMIGRKLGRYEVFSRFKHINRNHMQYLGTIDSHLFLPYHWCWNCQDYEPWSVDRHSVSPIDFNKYNLVELFEEQNLFKKEIHRAIIEPMKFAPMCPLWWGIDPSQLCHRGLDCDYCDCYLCEFEDVCPIHCTFPLSLWLPVPLTMPTVQSLAGSEDGKEQLDTFKEHVTNNKTIMYMDSVIGKTKVDEICDESIEKMCGYRYEPMLRTDFTLVPGTLGLAFKVLLPKSKYRVSQLNHDVVVLCKDHVEDKYVALVCGRFQDPIVYVTDFESDYSMYDYYLPAGMPNRFMFRHARVRFKDLEIVDRTYASLNIVYSRIISRPTIVRFRLSPSTVPWDPPNWTVEGLEKKFTQERCFKCGHIYYGKCPICSMRSIATVEDYVRNRRKRKVIDSIPETKAYLHPTILKRKSFKNGIRNDSYFKIIFNEKELAKPRFPGSVIQLGPKKESQILANARFFDKHPTKLVPAGTILVPNMHNFNVVKRNRDIRDDLLYNSPIMRVAGKEPIISVEATIEAHPPVNIVPFSRSDAPFVNMERLQTLEFFGTAAVPDTTESELASKVTARGDQISLAKPYNIPSVMPTTQGAAATTFQRPFEDVAAAARDFSGLVRDIKDRIQRFSIVEAMTYVNNVLAKINIQQITARGLGLLVSFTRHGLEWNTIMFFFIDLAFDISNAMEIVHCEMQHAITKDVIKTILNTDVSDKVKLERIAARVQGFGSIFNSLFGMLAGLSTKTLSHLRNFNTLCAAWRNGAPITRKLVSLLPRCILEFFGILSDNLLLNDEAYESFVRDFTAMESKFTADPKSIRDIPRADLMKLTEAASMFRKQAALCVTKGPIYTFTHMAFTRLQAMVSLYDDVDQLSFQRYNPIAILLHGEPGVGKSEVAKKIAAHYSQWAKGEMREDPTFLKMAKDGVYSYQSQLDYMDGYQQQGVVIVDELGAKSDGEDLLPFFSLVSSNTYVCPMASLDNAVIGKKGTTFTSHTIIACSNTSSFGHLTNSFIAPDAIDRRFLAKIYVSRVGPNTNDFSHLRFRINDPFGKGVEYTLPQLLYILKNHPSYGFDAYFSKQSKLDHAIMQLERVAMPQSLSSSFMNVFNTIVSLLSVRFGIHLYLMSTDSVGATISLIIAAVGFLSVITTVMNDLKISNLEEENANLRYWLNNFKKSTNPFVKEAGEIITAETQSKAKREFNQRRTARVVFTQGSARYAQKAHDILLESYNDLKAKDALDEELEEVYQQMFADLTKYELCVEPTRLDPKDPKLFERKREATSQGLRDKVAESIETKVASALCIISYHREGICVDRVNAIPLGHVHYLVPQHFFEHHKEGDEFILHWKGADLKYSFKIDDIVINQIAVDAAVISIPSLTFRCPSLIKNFITEEELVKLIDGTISLVTVQRNNIVTIHSTYGHVLTETTTYKGPDKVYQLVRGLDYNANTDVGDCGAPIISHNVNLSGKIVGMHVAGIDFEAYGMATVVTKNMIQDAIKVYDQEKQNPTQCVTMGAITLYGKHDPPIYQPARTSFYRSRITGLPVPKSPVDLHVRDGVDPILNAMMKNSIPRDNFKKFSAELLSRSISWYSQIFPKNRDVSILTLEESIKQYGKLGGLNLKTSPGYPYVLTSKKSDYIVKDQDGEYHIIDDKIIADVEVLEEQARIYPPEIVWITCGKDECLKPNKEPRVFEIAPMSFTLMARKYFGAFISWLHENPLHTMSAVGINPESSIWNRMYNNLANVSDSGLAVDWTKYDSTLAPEIMMAVIEVVNKWYEDEHSELRRNIGRALITRSTVYGDSWFNIYGGNPSGHFFTTPMNTLAHILLYTHFWLENAPDEYQDLYFFKKFVCLYVYGDDGIMTVAPPIRDWFNFENLSSYFAQYGMKLTTDAKDGSTGAFVPISDMTFLKRSFVPDHRGMIVPQLSWNSLYTMLNWNRKSKYATPEETLQINCRVFSQFLYFFGRKEYNYWRRKLDLDVPDYDYYDRLFYGGKEFPISY